MSHGDKYTGSEIEQAAKKTLVHMGISGETDENRLVSLVHLVCLVCLVELD